MSVNQTNPWPEALGPGSYVGHTNLEGASFLITALFMQHWDMSLVWTSRNDGIFVVVFHNLQDKATLNWKTWLHNSGTAQRQNKVWPQKASLSQIQSSFYSLYEWMLFMLTSPLITAIPCVSMFTQVLWHNKGKKGRECQLKGSGQCFKG